MSLRYCVCFLTRQSEGYRILDATVDSRSDTSNIFPNSQLPIHSTCICSLSRYLSLLLPKLPTLLEVDCLHSYYT